jgi:hypothetical protein
VKSTFGPAADSDLFEGINDLHDSDKARNTSPTINRSFFDITLPYPVEARQRFDSGILGVERLVDIMNQVQVPHN